MTVLVGRERRSGALIAHTVRKKGTGGGWIIHQLQGDVNRLAWSKKTRTGCDSEPALLLVKKVAILRTGETLIESALVGDSRANGRAETAVLPLEKQMRVITWLLTHAADLITMMCQIKSDGRTAYQRVKGRHHTDDRVRRVSQGPRKGHETEMAVRNMVGKALRVRRTCDFHF